MQTWTFTDRLMNPQTKTYRAATQSEIQELQKLPGAPHVLFACKCGKSHWSAKNIALSDSGQYNQQRNIFFLGDGLECSCSAKDLVCVVPV